jgi:hypothetical protein
MICMAKLTNDHKIAFRTAPSIDRRVRQILLDLQEEGMKFRSGHGSRRTKLGVEAVMGAILVDFLDRTEAECREIVRGRLPEYEALLAGGNEAPAAELPRRRVMRPVPGEGEASQAMSAMPKKGREKGTG